MCSPSLSRNPGQFPLKCVLLATLAPILFGLFFGGIVAKPILSSDVVVGVDAYLNFIENGKWGTSLSPDNNDISKSIESPITWWAPGLYLPIGVLNSLGIDFQNGALIIFSLASLSLGLGIAFLARALGVSNSLLPWISLTAVCSESMFSALSIFSGGDIALYASFPWIAFAAWEWRNRRFVLIVFLPLLFLFGYFLKYSSAIYSLAILCFLFLEVIRTLITPSPSLLNLSGKIIRGGLPLVVVGVIYVAGVYVIFPSGPSPANTNALSRDFLLLWGFNAFAPLIGSFNIKDFILIVFSSPLEFWTEFKFGGKGWLLTLLSPILYQIYFWLAVKSKSPLMRFSGVTALVACAVLFFLDWRGAIISLDPRHYQPAALLLMAALVVQAGSSKNKITSFLLRSILVTFISWAAIGMMRFHLTLHRVDNGSFSRMYQVIYSDVPSPVLEELKSLSKENKESLFFLGS